MAKSDTVNRKDPSERGSSAAATTDVEGGGVMGFAKGATDELKKVVWPSRQQLIGESTAVFLIVVLFASFIFLIDKLFGALSTYVFG